MLDTWMIDLAWIEWIGRALLHSLWQGALIALAYLVLHRALQRARPALRVLLGELSLLACVLLPVATVYWQQVASPAVVPAAAAIEAITLAPALEAAGGSVRSPFLAGLALAWMLGVGVLGLRALWRWQGLRGIVARAQPIAPDWQQRLLQLCDEVGVLRPVRWLESGEVEGPMLVGWLRPVVLFPLGLSLRLPAEQVELLLEHELAHIRRADFLFNLIQLLVETLLFFHPGVHAIAARVRHDRELACDDRVAARRQQPTVYARALLAVAELRLVAAPMVLAATGGALLQRVRRIVGEDEVSERQGSPLRALAVAGLVLLVIALGVQRSEVPLQALKLPVSAVLVRSLQQVGVEPIRAPTLAIELAPALPVIEATPAVLRPIALPMPARSAPQASIETRDLPVAGLSAPPMLAMPAAAEPLVRQAPYYPSRARRSGIEGWVELSYLVAADGSVADIRVEAAQPEDLFVEAATTALQQWRFAAGGETLRRSQRFDFTLREADAKSGSNPPFCDLPTGTRVCRHPR